MGGGLGGFNVVTRCGGGGGARGTEDSLEGPVNGVASPGSMASSTTGPTTSLSRPPSLLTSTCDLNDPFLPLFYFPLIPSYFFPLRFILLLSFTFVLACFVG